MIEMKLKKLYSDKKQMCEKLVKQFVVDFIVFNQSSLN